MFAKALSQLQSWFLLSQDRRMKNHDQNIRIKNKRCIVSVCFSCLNLFIVCVCVNKFNCTVIEKGVP